MYKGDLMTDSPAPFGLDDQEEGARSIPASYLEPITNDAQLAQPDPDAVGRTMFDTPGAEDGSVTVLLPKEEIAKVPLQSLVRIASREDGRTYLGIVVSGPFAEPDGLRADANVIVTTTVYHPGSAHCQTVPCLSSM